MPNIFLIALELLTLRVPRIYCSHRALPDYWLISRNVIISTAPTPRFSFYLILIAIRRATGKILQFGTASSSKATPSSGLAKEANTN